MFARQKSEKELPEDLSAIPKLLSFKYVGDVVDNTHYRVSDYNDGKPRSCSLRTKKHPERKSDDPDGDTITTESAGFGFDLTSMTSLRGHFIDHVVPFSEAERAGLKQGDLVVEINGIKVKDITHQDLVTMIEDLSEKEELLTLVVVSKIEITETTTVLVVPSAVADD